VRQFGRPPDGGLGRGVRFKSGRAPNISLALVCQAWQRRQVPLRHARTRHGPTSAAHGPLAWFAWLGVARFTQDARVRRSNSTRRERGSGRCLAPRHRNRARASVIEPRALGPARGLVVAMGRGRERLMQSEATSHFLPWHASPRQIRPRPVRNPPRCWRDRFEARYVHNDSGVRTAHILLRLTSRVESRDACAGSRDPDLGEPRQG